MHFLTEGEILAKVNQLVTSKGELLAAVAYWGADAVDQTGLVRRRGTAKVLCDLFSGACNPREIRRLLENGVEVKTLRGMHAKVWLSGQDVIVGSANASMNGLGFEGALSVVPNIEASVHLRDKKIAGQVRTWFERKWRRGAIVNDEKLRFAEELWNRKQNANGHFRGIAEQHRIIAYCEGEYSNEASDYWEQNRRALYSEEELQSYDDMGDWPLYEMEPDWAYRPAPSTVYLDFSPLVSQRWAAVRL